jgi:pimeloyl-ACP methyl ester carboxylesterase
VRERIPGSAPDLPLYGTRDDYVADVVEHIDDERVLLIGQSLGGHTAMLVAARHPELVERLVMIEASPERDTEAPGNVRMFFETNPSAYGAQMDPELAAATVAELAERDWWEDWQRVECPTLIVRGDEGYLSDETVERMLAANGYASATVITGAGHDVHLDQPQALADAIEHFAQDSTPSTSDT